MAVKKLDSEKMASKWQRNLQNAQQDMEDGVNKVQEAPSAGAVRQQAKMKAKLMAAIDTGKWAQNTRATTLQDYQESMKKIGIPRAIAGASDKLDNTRAAMADLAPQLEAVSREIQAMPQDTEAQRDARAAKTIQLMRKVRRKRT